MKVYLSVDIEGVACVTTTKYVIDSHNHTGYAQVFKQIAPDTNTVFIYGHDAIAEATDSVRYYLHDGHGSVRLLSDSTGALVTGASYNYDAYGRAHGFNPGDSGTSKLYADNLVWRKYDVNSSPILFFLHVFSQEIPAQFSTAAP